jgi:hypothetical protein
VRDLESGTLGSNPCDREQGISAVLGFSSEIERVLGPGSKDSCNK